MKTQFPSLRSGPRKRAEAQFVTLRRPGAALEATTSDQTPSAVAERRRRVRLGLHGFSDTGQAAPRPEAD